MKEAIIKIIDWFYIPSVRRYIPPETFRYAACGGANMVLNWVLYFVTFHYVVCEKDMELGFVTISAHIAAFLIVSPITLATGYLLNRNIAFQGSPLRDTTKIFRYVSVWALNFTLNCFGLKLLVDVVHIYPTPSNITVTLITVVISYLLQRNYTFRGFRGENGGGYQNTGDIQ